MPTDFSVPTAESVQKKKTERHCTKTASPWKDRVNDDGCPRYHHCFGWDCPGWELSEERTRCLLLVEGPTEPLVRLEPQVPDAEEQVLAEIAAVQLLDWGVVCKTVSRQRAVSTKALGPHVVCRTVPWGRSTDSQQVRVAYC